MRTACWCDRADMHVIACIVGFRNAPDIVRCVAALEQSTYPDFEIVVCENGGPEAHADLSRALPTRLAGGQPVEVILAPGNIGYAGGVNVGMRARPNADAWWVVNPDTEPDPDAMGALVARLRDGDVDGVGGTLYLGDGRVQGHGGHWRSWFARAESIGHGSPLAAVPEREHVEAKLSYLLGASMMVGRPFVDRVGLMREDYFLYAEEVEWGLRAKAAGLRLGWAPEARIRHGQGATTGSADAIHVRPRLPIYLDERNKLNVVRDTMPARLPVAAVGAFAMLGLRFARRGAWRQFGYALAGWWAGVRNERGLPPWMR
jgi:N-acetylglucosaminyl-diphospho-decaprenol L-rhamnosyltransferase